MGYSITRFVASVDANLLCSICSAVLEDPVLTPCGHSFCLLCLETWLEHSGANSCPECRGAIGSDETRPIRSVRNLINGLEVVCENRSRGCDAVMRVDSARTHLDSCRYGPVQCAGCTETVSRCELPEHHVKCAVIAAVLGDDDDDAEEPSAGDALGISRQVSELALRVSSLELKLRRMKRELEVAETQNKRLERQLRKTRDELEQKRRLLLDTQYADFDPDYEYGYRPETVSKLSRFIARFLRHKPSYVSASRVFAAIKRCHDNFAAAASSGAGCQDDIHMLLATAFSSNWFSDEQRVKLRCWLQIMAHCLRYRPATTVSTTAKMAGHQDLRRLHITSSAAI